MKIEIFKVIRGQRENVAELRSYIHSLTEVPLVEDFDGGRRYYSFPKTGISLVFDDSKLKEVQLFTAGVEENTECYQDQLPNDLNFSDSSDRIFIKLGPPDLIKEGTLNHKLLGVIYPWCKYLFGDYSLRIEFEMDKSKIRMVSLS